jgi:hypothetical protein
MGIMVHRRTMHRRKTYLMTNGTAFLDLLQVFRLAILGLVSMVLNFFPLSLTLRTSRLECF